MPKRQKTLMIILAIVAAYAIYSYLPGDDPGSPANNPGIVTGRITNTPPPAPGLPQNQIANRTQRQVTQGGQGTQTFQPPPNLELRDDPFYRPPSLQVSVADTQAQFSALTGLAFQGTFGKRALINDTPYQVNEIIMGFTIIEFSSERVILSDNEGKRHVLRKNQ